VRLTIAAQHDRLFRELPETIEVFQWHGEYFDTPPGAVNLAGSELYQCQAFSIGRNVYGLLFHLEVTGQIVREWVAIFKEELEGVKEYIRPDRTSVAPHPPVWGGASTKQTTSGWFFRSRRTIARCAPIPFP